MCRPSGRRGSRRSGGLSSKAASFSSRGSPCSAGRDGASAGDPPTEEVQWPRTLAGAGLVPGGRTHSQQEACGHLAPRPRAPHFRGSRRPPTAPRAPKPGLWCFCPHSAARCRVLPCGPAGLSVPPRVCKRNSSLYVKADERRSDTWDVGRRRAPQSDRKQASESRGPLRGRVLRSCVSGVPLRGDPAFWAGRGVCVRWPGPQLRHGCVACSHPCRAGVLGLTGSVPGGRLALFPAVGSSHCVPTRGTPSRGIL